MTINSNWKSRFNRLFRSLVFWVRLRKKIRMRNIAMSMRIRQSDYKERVENKWKDVIVQ